MNSPKMKSAVSAHTSRIPVFISLICSTIVFGGLSYFFFYESETELLDTQIRSINTIFDFAINNEIEVKKNSLLAMGAYIESEFPNASSWPYVSVPKTTFTKITDPLIEMAKLRTLGLLPIVESHEIDTFETYADNFFDEQGYADYLGVSDFGFGIYGVNSTTGSRYHDKVSQAKGKYDILLPILQTGNLDQNIAAVMYNIYSEEHRASAVDYAFDCTEPHSSVECVSVTNFIHIVQDGVYRPAALIIYPLIALDDSEGNKTVGAIHGVINWDDVVEGSLPSFAKGIEIAVKSSYDEVAYFEYDAPGTTYKASSTSNGYSPFHKVDIDLKHTQYTISLSLTPEYVSSHRTWTPVIACAIAVSITLLTAGIFLIYDRSINHDLLQREIDSETKRLFVRYISHEIRTPLNTVHLGLQVLHDEMECFIDSGALDILGTVAKTQSQEIKKQLRNCKPFMVEWTNFITNIDDSAEDAIAVLSDLLDFDKVSTGMMNFERDIHDVSQLIAETIRPFSVNARAKNVKLTYVTLPPVDDTSQGGLGFDEHPEVVRVKGIKNITTPPRILMFGDNIKIQQVVRNLVSNALKFTPDGGQVVITACWNKTTSAKSSLVPNSTSFNVAFPEDQLKSKYVPSGHVILRVKDSGAGMTAHQLAQLFQEGVQFDANKLQAGQGSGLGLWISKEVVTQHGGCLRAESEGKGKGAEFILEIPAFLPASPDTLNKHVRLAVPRMTLTGNATQSLELTHTAPAALPPSPTNAISSSIQSKIQGATSSTDEAFSNYRTPSTMPVTSSHMRTSPILSMSLDTSSSPASNRASSEPIRVLVVDDSSSTRKVVCRLLTNMGCTVLEAGDGKECFEMVSKDDCPHIDIILMDYEMPIMNGPVTVAKLVEDLNSKIPILGVTGNAYHEDKLKFIDRGAVDVLVKPLNVPILKAALSTHSPAFAALQEKAQARKLAKKQSSSSVTEMNNQKSSKSSEIGSILKIYHTEVDLRNHRVLVVDDSSSTRKVICRLLKNMGCVTEEAADGQECIDTVLRKDQTPFDIILMDYEMPVMNGPTATFQLRQLGVVIPIIGVTGNVLKADTDYFKSMGAFEVLHKPLTILKVKGLLSRWLGQDTRDSSSSSTASALEASPCPSPVTTSAPSLFQPSQSHHNRVDGKSSPPLLPSVGGDDEDGDWCMMALNL